MVGLRAHDATRCSEQRNLVDWAKPLLMKRKKIKSLMDRRIEGQYPLKAAVLLGDLTLKCLETDPRKRPSMQEVLETLEQIEKLKDKPKGSKISNSQSKQLHQRHAKSSIGKKALINEVTRRDVWFKGFWLSFSLQLSGTRYDILAWDAQQLRKGKGAKSSQVC